MADYIFEVPLSNEGRDAIDADVINLMATKGSSLIPRVTYDNLSVESVYIDLETKKFYYNINASPTMKLGLASFNIEERLAWYDILVAGVAIAGAVVCVYLGAVPVAIGLTVVAGIALVRESISGIVEAKVTKADTEKIIAQGVVDGKITPEEGEEFLNAINEGWGADIPWTMIIVGGMVGVGALAALYIFLKR